MSDSSPEYAGESMEGELSSPEDQTTQIVNQNIMDEVQQLIEENKYTALVKVIKLSIEHVNQQKEITNLQQQIKQVLEERVQTKSDLIVQHNFKKNVQSIEDEKHATSIRLREQLEAINAQLKSNDAKRSHLKEDDAVARSAMGEIRKVLDELTEKGNVLQYWLKKGEDHLKTLNQQLHSAAEEKDKLQHDCHAQERELHNVSSHYAASMQQIKNELMEKDSHIKQRVEELKREQQNLSKQANVEEQLQSELNVMRNEFDQLKQTIESELWNDGQQFRKEIALAKESLEEQKMKNEKLIENMTNSIAGLIEQKKATDERINELRYKQRELSNNLQNLNDHNSKLKQELENYDRNKQTGMKFAILKESIKASKTSAMPARHDMGIIMRPRRHVFTKASKNNNEVTTNDPPITIVTDSELSSALDESTFFEGKL